MQYHLEINLPADFSIRDKEKAIFELLEANQETLAFMLQGYHTKEKVRHVLLRADSLKFEGAGKGSVTAVYQLEEYNVCSAIDRTDMETMILSFIIDELRNTLKVSGVFIPEREPDSF
ncbi:hypothetical protein [Pedobacter polysacchareus]|uniref:hypothetical protein n=1 Tax=Pedobacter polysacchareus TaxID=2861973 RepID=UPI001C9952D1|nr:hypothetical protein [Pedobacter polysacchareus]